MTKELCLITNRHELSARACVPNNQMEVLMKKLLKLPLRLCRAICDALLRTSPRWGKPHTPRMMLPWELPEGGKNGLLSLDNQNRFPE